MCSLMRGSLGLDLCSTQCCRQSSMHYMTGEGDCHSLEWKPCSVNPTVLYFEVLMSTGKRTAPCGSGQVLLVAFLCPFCVCCGSDKLVLLYCLLWPQ